MAPLRQVPSKEEIVELFEGHRDLSSCPYGPGWCGVGEPCPLHDTIVALNVANAAKLKKINFAAFSNHPKPHA
jgi:Rrf2 family transcriptional regulator, iron-sulfur cluster assembly transcription factor